jgi:hypothetical protein
VIYSPITYHAILVVKEGTVEKDDEDKGGGGE